jgi:hypothetical protein
MIVPTMFRPIPYSVLALSAASAILVWSAGENVVAQAKKISPEQVEFFESKIRPVLVRECYSCHSEQTGQNKGGLRLDNKTLMELGGDSGPAIVAGDLESSLLINAINHYDLQMPPEKKLPSSVIADFETWVEMGAPDPRVTRKETVQSTVTKEDIVRGRKFWSFVPPKRPEIPTTEKMDWVRSSIDHFVLEKLGEQQLEPAKDADSYALLRRLTFDLTGLPPTPAEIESFSEQWSVDPDSAIAAATDRLLASPQYGEHWGRHWLDLARYAESTGREVNATFPNAWRYRDYVIDSFNADKPYNQFVQEQIAGDLLPAKDDKQWVEHLIATGFLAIGPKALTERNGRQFNLDLIDEQIDVSTRVVLGISVACARCHDHKFDPIPQKDYYALAGIFESTSTHYGTFATQQNRRSSNFLILPISDPNPSDRALTAAQIDSLKKQIEDSKSELRELQRKIREARRSNQNSRNSQTDFLNITRLTARISRLETVLYSVDEKGNPISFCMGVQDKEQVGDTRLLVRGEFDQPAEPVERGFVQVLSQRPARIPANRSGRLELARWMTDKKNPLTARVMVNRVWLHLFGEGLVRTPENFGATGMRPTHPELLDYLAIEFVRNNWSVKSLIRQIVSSRTYRMSSRFNDQHFALDPENFYLWRMNPRQLNAESIRDAMLAVSGDIDLERPLGSLVAKAGESVVRDGRIPAPQLEDVTEPVDSMTMSPLVRRRADFQNAFRVFDVDQPADFRSIYLPIVRDNVPHALEVFDFAEPGLVIGQRETSNTPTQGLYLLNNDFVIQQSMRLAERVALFGDTTEQQLDWVFRLAYARPATDQEINMAYDFYQNFDPPRTKRNRSQSTQVRKLAAVAQAVMAAAEFRYLD